MIIIDGYNLIHALPELRRRLLAGDLAGAREGLLLLLRTLDLPKAYGAVSVVFDGARFSPGRHRDSRFRVLFSRAPRKADEEIWELLRAHPRGKHLVISGDQQVQSYARREDADWESPEYVLRLRRAGSAGRVGEEKPQTLTSDELEQYMKLFGEDGDGE